MGLQKSCVIETSELDDSEKEAFEEVKRESRRDENVRDAYVYYFNFEENNQEKEVVVEETCIEDKMMPFIKKVNNNMT